MFFLVIKVYRNRNGFNKIGGLFSYIGLGFWVVYFCYIGVWDFFLILKGDEYIFLSR